MIMEQLNDKTLGGLFESIVGSRGNHSFIVFEDKEYTYNEANIIIDRIAKGFLAMGFKRGEHVALWMGNSPLWVFIEQAAYKIGVVLVVLNTHCTYKEIIYMLQQSDSVGIVFEKNVFRHAFLPILDEITQKNYASPSNDESQRNLPLLRTIIGLGEDLPNSIVAFDEMLQAGEQVSHSEMKKVQDDIVEDDIALMIYTSGTTGLPKGALIQHKSIFVRSKVFVEWFKLSKNDVGFYGQPLYHIFGCVAAVEATIFSGGTLCLQQRFDASEGLLVIEKYRCSMIYCVPTVLDELIHHTDFYKYDFSSMRVGVVSGAPVAPALVKEAKATFVPELAIGYGCTECCAMVVATRLDDSPEAISGKVGIVTPYNELRIVGVDSGLPLTTGQDGEICVRSEYNMTGYYELEGATLETIDKAGFLHTGDVGRLDENGYLSLTGRKKEMIIVGGVNVYPKEIENALCEYESIAQAQVVGVPDKRLGEVPFAFLILEEGISTIDPENLFQFCRSTLSSFKVPKYAHTMESFPMTPSGKTRKRDLKEIVEEILDKSLRLY